MPIRPFLDGQKFDSETIRVMGLAFETALVALRLADRGDLANEVIARQNYSGQTSAIGVPAVTFEHSSPFGGVSWPHQGHTDFRALPSKG